MRTVFTPALLAVSLFASVAPALAAPDQCISVRDIRNSEQQNNGNALLFTMRDGTQWRNTLRGACPDLVFNGFVWVLHSDTVCANAQTFRVLQSGEICALGKFEKLAPTPPKG
jgi:hypothetical protein